MHLKIKNKHDCSGCTACASICPKHCITMFDDRLGFSYPKVDTSKCIDCGLCTKTCPFINISSALGTRICYSAFNCNDSIRMRSSSGGVFFALAKKVLSNQGIVFGAVFEDSGKVIHREAMTEEDILPMMGSKYVQSDISGIYNKVKDFLRQGRAVLFTGTPCQIAGLNHYLQKPYEKLLTAEVICHGVPSPFVFGKYFKQHNVASNNSYQVLTKINFRDKRNGWRKFGLSIDLNETNGLGRDIRSSKYYESFSTDPYMQAFLKNLSLRPSCYSCKAKSGISHADITIGDFWGIENYNLPNDDRGTSCVIARSEKGERFITSIDGLVLTECKYDQILSGNTSLEQSAYETDASLRFKRAILRRSLTQSIDIAENPSIWSRIYYAINRRIKIICKHQEL